MEKNPILITTAMNSEMNLLIEKIENKVKKIEYGFEIYEGMIKNYPVILLKTNVGEINAAIGITLAIQKYHPIAIVNQGTAGSHEKSYKKFDLIIGDSIININSVKTGIRQNGEGSTPLELEIKEFISDSEDKIIIYKSDDKMMELAQKIAKNYTYGEVHVGRIGSGDIWNREVDRINWFNKNLKTVCEEMEGISNYKVAKMFNIPIINFRVISNNELNGEKFDSKTTEASQSFTYDFIKELVKNLE